MSTPFLTTLITCVIISLNTASDCSLLQSDTEWKDTESESALTAMCNGDTSSLSLWETYQCESMRTRDGYQKCWPQRRMSTCPPSSLRGIMVLYHGFSACPDANNGFAAELQDECWHVYQITTIGHGFTYCGRATSRPSNVTTDQPCTAGKYNLTTLPTSKQAYIDFVQRMNTIIADEVTTICQCEDDISGNKDLEVAVGGLSFGAPLATAAVVLGGKPSIYTKLIIMSPFFGIASKGVDDILYKCLQNTNDWHECLPTFFTSTGFNVSETAAQALSSMVGSMASYYTDVSHVDNSFATFNLMVRKVISWAVEAPELITDSKQAAQVEYALDYLISWGEKCIVDELPVDVPITLGNYSGFGLGRGGFCKFAVRKLAAAHSFAQYITQQYVASHEMDESVETLAIMVERDGKTGASMTNNYIHLFYRDNVTAIRAKTSDCMWLISEECQVASYAGEVDNTCGVPHAWIAQKDNLLIPPYKLYWESYAIQGMIDWLQGDPISSADFITKTQWDGSRGQCVYLDLINPPRALVADTPELLVVQLAKQKVTSEVKDNLLDYVSNLTGTPRGMLELTYQLMQDEETDSSTISMFLDKNSARLLQTLLQHDGLDQLGDIQTSNVTVRGQGFVLAATSATVPTVCTKEDDVGKSIMFLLIGVVVGAVLLAAIGGIVVKSKGYELVPTDDKKYGLMKDDL
eukprot:93651_1